MVRQCGTSRKWIRSDGRSEVVGATLRGELGAGVEGEWEAEMEAEAEGEAGGVPLTGPSLASILPNPRKAHMPDTCHPIYSQLVIKSPYPVHYEG